MNDENRLDKVREWLAMYRGAVCVLHGAFAQTYVVMLFTSLSVTCPQTGFLPREFQGK